MNKKQQIIWEEAMKYLQQGIRKDFVLHTKNVVRAMQMIIENRSDINKNKIIIAAILHDVGWAKVPSDIQLNWRKDNNGQIGKGLHIKYAPSIIEEILKLLNYDQKFRAEIIRIIQGHHLNNPKTIEEKLLIDADNLSDIFKESIESDAKTHHISIKENLEFRKQNKFYTKIAADIFQSEVKKREAELS